MKEYYYDEVTGEYTGSDEVFMDAEGKALLSANATLSKPPDTIKYQAVVFVNGDWTVKPDYREYKFWLMKSKWDSEPDTIKELGVKPPEIHLKEPPPKPPELILKDKIDASKAEVTRIIESVAKAYGYDSAISMRSYFDGTESGESLQAQEFTKWTSEVWRKAYDMMAGEKIPELKDIKNLISKPEITGKIIDESVYPF